MYRQGDVLLVETTIPGGSRVVSRKLDGYPRVKGIVLAAGEATGHHHTVEDPRARLITRGSQRFLRVAPGGAELTHEEHDTIQLAPGEYEIRRQREYEPPRAESRSSRPSSRYVYD